MMYAGIQRSQANCSFEILFSFWWSTALNVQKSISKIMKKRREIALSMIRFIRWCINLQYLHCELTLFRKRYEHQYDLVQLQVPPGEIVLLPTTFSVSWTLRQDGDRFPRGWWNKANSIRVPRKPKRKLNSELLSCVWVENAGNELSILPVIFTANMI